MSGVRSVTPFLFSLLVFLSAGFGSARAECRSASPAVPAARDSVRGGMHVVMLGDSNTWLGGDSCDGPRGWTRWFNERFAPATCRSYARSGATWTHTPATRYNVREDIGVIGDDNVVWNQANRLREACDAGVQPVPDLIFIAAGVNDVWFTGQRPQAFAASAEEAFATASGDSAARPPKPHEALTIAASVRYVCELLMERFPGAQIVLLTPFQTTPTDPGLLRRAGDLIEECGHRMGIAVIRLDFLSGISRTQESARRTFTTDGTHTNEAGARRIGSLVARQTECLLLR